MIIDLSGCNKNLNNKKKIKKSNEEENDIEQK